MDPSEPLAQVPAVRHSSQPNFHYPVERGDLIFVFGEWHRIVGMVALGMPVREITLNVEHVEVDVS